MQDEKEPTRGWEKKITGGSKHQPKSNEHTKIHQVKRNVKNIGRDATQPGKSRCRAGGSKNPLTYVKKKRRTARKQGGGRNRTQKRNLMWGCRGVIDEPS